MSRRFDAGRAAYLTLNGAIVAFLLLPIAIVIIFALNPTPYIAFPPVGITTRWFVKFFTSPEFMNALWLSLRVAVIVVVLSTTIGALCALGIARGRGPGDFTLAVRLQTKSALLQKVTICLQDRASKL